MVEKNNREPHRPRGDEDCDNGRKGKALRLLHRAYARTPAHGRDIQGARRQRAAGHELGVPQPRRRAQRLPLSRRRQGQRGAPRHGYARSGRQERAQGQGSTRIAAHIACGALHGADSRRARDRRLEAHRERRRARAPALRREGDTAQGLRHNNQDRRRELRHRKPSRRRREPSRPVGRD